MYTSSLRELLLSHAKRTYRVTFYLNDEEVHHLDNAVADADMERAEYLRAMLMGDAGSTEKQGDSIVLQESLTHAHRSIDRLEQLLLHSQSTVSNLTLALPAPASNGHRPWWRVW